MRGCCAERACGSYILDYRNGERRALDGVCACAKLVEKNKGVLAFFLYYRDDIYHLRRKCRERLLYALLVSERDENIIEYAERASLVGGDMEPGLRHKRKKSKGFKAYRFSACVGACYYYSVIIVADSKAYRNDLFLVYKGMSCLNEIACLAAVYDRLCAVKAKREARAGKEEGNFGYVLVIEQKRRSDSRNACRKLGEYTLYLKLFLVFKHAQLVVCLDHRHRLYKYGSSR